MRPFHYRLPETPADAVEQVEPWGEPARSGAFLAGGTTVVDLMKLGVMAPTSLTDVQRLGLNEIDDDGETVRLGARVTMAQAAEHPLFAERAPVLGDALWLAASPQLRNVATLAGNVLQRTRCPYFRDNVSPCNKRTPGAGCAARDGVNRLLAVLGTSEHCIASYAGDWANALILFDAVVETRHPGGRRDIPLEHFHLEPANTPHRETVLEPQELITGFRLTVPPWARRSLYVKVRDRASYAFALSAAAVALKVHNGVVEEARLGLGGVATRPWRAAEAEAYLRGRTLDEGTAMAAGRVAFRGAQGHGDNDFKLRLGPRTVAKALLQAAALNVAAGQGGER